MPSLSKFTFAILSCGAITSAAPAAQSSAQWSECQPGTWFYRCANGYVGYFNYDPCGMPQSSTANDGVMTTNTIYTTTSTDTISVATTTSFATVQPSSHWTECQSGTWFYRCTNGYVGCYNQDPCSLSQSPAALNDVVSTSTAYATSATAPPTNTPLTRKFVPTMWYIQPSQPDIALPPVHDIDLQRNGEHLILEQVVAFTGIPSNARLCQVGWAQAAPSERNFTYQGQGSVNITELTGFTNVDIGPTYNSVLPFVDYFQMGSITRDFGTWVDSAATIHSPWDVECAENVYLKIRLSDLDHEGFVHFEQDYQNGFYVQYTY